MVPCPTNDYRISDPSNVDTNLPSRLVRTRPCSRQPLSCFLSHGSGTVYYAGNILIFHPYWVMADLSSIRCVPVDQPLLMTSIVHHMARSTIVSVSSQPPFFARGWRWPCLALDILCLYVSFHFSFFMFASKHFKLLFSVLIFFHFLSWACFYHSRGRGTGHRQSKKVGLLQIFSLFLLDRNIAACACSYCFSSLALLILIRSYSGAQPQPLTYYVATYQGDQSQCSPRETNG